jgi:hypothetical protein
MDAGFFRDQANDEIGTVSARIDARAAQRCRRKFRRFFRKGFYDPTYLDWERGYKWQAHRDWKATLDEPHFRRALGRGAFDAIAAAATRIESRTNLLFSFEKMALRDAVRSPEGAEAFAAGLYALLHGDGPVEDRFTRWCQLLSGLPRRQTRVLTWPVATVFAFIAQPARHFFFKPQVTRRAAQEYGLTLDYDSVPNGVTYRHLLELARRVKSDLKDLKPRDMIDIQSFLWVQGSDEYEE